MLYNNLSYEIEHKFHFKYVLSLGHKDMDMTKVWLIFAESHEWVSWNKIVYVTSLSLCLEDKTASYEVNCVDLSGRIVKSKK